MCPRMRTAERAGIPLTAKARLQSAVYPYEPFKLPTLAAHFPMWEAQPILYPLPIQVILVVISKVSTLGICEHCRF